MIYFTAKNAIIIFYQKTTMIKSFCYKIIRFCLKITRFCLKSTAKL
jgi:hypothetical protein